MARPNQNSKWKAHQSEEPISELIIVDEPQIDESVTTTEIVTISPDLTPDSEPVLNVKPIKKSSK